jgi:hypothetical protein
MKSSVASFGYGPLAMRRLRREYPDTQLAYFDSLSMAAFFAAAAAAIFV